ncbi:hypothetical protein AVEN_234362-1 [Araneus ventricosus]|uniref:Uncharacterized protein n=1 Tax=Araneus ventricosus TaxID=182803 RepID=A0A4Y2AAT4_ARAVE|nr:hypothetical protein AVEN_234362-1 [Araneus ventricosus]
MKPRHLNCLAHFGDPAGGSNDVRESVYMYIYKEKIVREHLTGPQHYPDNGLVSGTRGEVSRNQEEGPLRHCFPPKPGFIHIAYLFRAVAASFNYSINSLTNFSAASTSALAASPLILQLCKLNLHLSR